MGYQQYNVVRLTQTAQYHFCQYPCLGMWCCLTQWTHSSTHIHMFVIVSSIKLCVRHSKLSLKKRTQYFKPCSEQSQSQLQCLTKHSLNTHISNVSNTSDIHLFFILMTAVRAEAISRQQTMEQYLSTCLHHLWNYIHIKTDHQIQSARTYCALGKQKLSTDKILTVKNNQAIPQIPIGSLRCVCVCACVCRVQSAEYGEQCVLKKQLRTK